MKKVTKLILTMVSGVVFAISLIFFVMGIANSGPVNNNKPDEHPIVWTKQFRIASTSSYTFGGQKKQYVVITGTIQNIDDSNHYMELYVTLHHTTGKKAYLVDDFTLSPDETKIINKQVYVDPELDFIGVESATAMMQSVPYKIAENKIVFMIEPSLIPAGIFMIGGLISFFVFVGVKPKYVEEETITSVDAPYIGDLFEEIVQKQQDQLGEQYVDCEYCGSSNKLSNGKCSACGARLKKGKRK